MHIPTNLIADSRRADLIAECRRANLIREAAMARHTAERPRARDRLAARLCRHRLDRALAGDPVPPARAGLALRARMLADPAVRSALGRQLRRVVEDATLGHASSGVRIRPSRPDVLGAAYELDALADRLQAPDPVATQGVAQARLLLIDGAGPLYRRGGTDDLRAAVARALASLRPELGVQR